jgi:predicted Zn-dependent protease
MGEAMRNWFLLVTVICGGCATNPVTGKSQLSLVSESQEIAMGREQLAASKADPGFVRNDRLERYVTDVGMGMARASERPDLPWEFHVIDDPAVNAFAAPGGFIFVTRGLLGYLNSEAQLAEVLAHEIGHVTAKHTVAMISQQELARGGLGLFSVVKPDLARGIAGQAATVLASLYFLKYSRGDEHMADELGHRYSLRAGYDPREMPKTFRTLQQLDQSSSSSKLPGFLSTHPDPGDRVAYTQAWADTVRNAARLKIGRDAFLATTDGLLYGADPEQGYFEGGQFLHPVLRIRFAVPAGWTTANQSAQVLVAEPNGAAQVSLRLSTQAGLDAATQAFLMQQGLQGLGTERLSMGGMPATSGEFVATSQAGKALHGEVLFVQREAQIFQVVGLSFADGWSQFGPTIHQALRSFGPTQPGQRFQQRRWIRLITLQRPTAITALAAETGESISAADLAILNSVDVNATLPAGTRVKTVVSR